MRKLSVSIISILILSFVASISCGTASERATEFSSEIERLRGLAAQGDREAQYWLGNAYFFGKEVQQNIDEAVSLYEKSSAQQFPAAMYTLGVFYLRGTFGVSKNEVEGVRLIEGAADRGVIDAACTLIITYSQVEGLKDEDRSLYWKKYIEEKGFDCVHGKK